jgi:hypothetical protein
MNRFSSILAAVIILGAASIASAATVSKYHVTGSFGEQQNYIDKQNVWK